MPPNSKVISLSLHQLKHQICLITILLLGCFLFNACEENAKPKSETYQYNIIPLPNEVIPQAGHFVLKKNTAISIDPSINEHSQLLPNFRKDLQEITSQPIGTSAPFNDNKISFHLSDTFIGKDAYQLSITTNDIVVTTSTATGVFYAIQTIKQLIQQNEDDWIIPAVTIKDSPRFPYRGMHLDVARHFYEVSTVKKMIDQMAYHKLNYFHWHLTDDQGWRIEIKQYPKLTSVGAYRNGTLIGHYNDQPHQFDGKRYGGFYTQEEIKEIVAYAQERFITVIPEIEMPGHAQAAIAAYPELACVDGEYEVWQLWGVSDNVYCPTETTFNFLENVLDEVIALFPSPYIHIGGDECPKTKWKESSFCQDLMKKEGLKDEMELQSYFIQRIEKYINNKGRKIIGWDEILEGGLAPNATVMSWRGVEGGIEAAKAGHDVVMTPTSHCYFDYYQSAHPEEPLAIGGLLPVEKVYALEPIPDELTPEESIHILGAQGNIWTEYITTPEHLEYMAFPRLCALSEVVWTNKEQKDFNGFIQRLTIHLDCLKGMGVKPANHLYDIKGIIRANVGQLEANLQTLAPDATIHYTTDGSTPNLESPTYTDPFKIDKDGMIQAISARDGQAVGKLWSEQVQVHKAAGKSIQLSTDPHPKYSGEGHASIINGVLGSDERYGDAEWLGFEEEDVEVIIDLAELTTIDSIQFRFFNGEGQWIYLPSAVKCWISNDGETFDLLGASGQVKAEDKVAELSIYTDELISTRFLKIEIINFGTIPEGRQGAGHKSWLFIDEIRVY